jgi:hypothetical protein
MTKFRHRKNGGAWTEVNVSLPYAIPGTSNGDTVDAQGIGRPSHLLRRLWACRWTPSARARPFSVRLLRTAYGFASPCIDVRRSSDNAVATIPFKLYAPRATPYWLDEDATLAHCGAGNGFVPAWYDQTTNARHITNAVTGQQPRIVNAGVIEKQNGLPALYFDNALNSRLTNAFPFMFAAGSATAIIAAKLATQSNRTLWAERNSGTATPIYRMELGGTGNNDIAYRWRNDAATTTSANLFIDEVNDTLRNYALRDTGSQFQPYVNGVEEAPVNYTRSGATTVNIFGLGANPTSANIEAITGHISEAIFFGSALSNANMNTINLSQGAAFGISVEEYLTPVQRLIQINGTPDGGSSFAVGGGGVRDWEDPIFIDRAKQARGWQSPCVLDSLSRCASLSSGTTATFFFSSFQDGSGVYAGATPNRGGRFRVELTSGAATLTSNTGCTNVTQINSTTWEFDCDWVANKALTFTPSAFPLSVSIVDVNLLANHAAGEIFDPLFLSTLPTGGAWRNMDWMGTNSSPIVEWADYPTAASQNWFRIPVSVMVALANAKSLNPWFNMPHQASTDFVTQFATYVLANLNSGLKVRVEVSNEAWNFIFGQATYFSNLANTEWPPRQAKSAWRRSASASSGTSRYGTRSGQGRRIASSAFSARKRAIRASQPNFWTPRPGSMLTRPTTSRPTRWRRNWRLPTMWAGRMPPRRGTRSRLRSTSATQLRSPRSRRSLQPGWHCPRATSTRTCPSPPTGACASCPTSTTTTSIWGPRLRLASTARVNL